MISINVGFLSVRSKTLQLNIRTKTQHTLRQRFSNMPKDHQFVKYLAAKPNFNGWIDKDLYKNVWIAHSIKCNDIYSKLITICVRPAIMAVQDCGFLDKDQFSNLSRTTLSLIRIKILIVFLSQPHHYNFNDSEICQ